MFVVLVHFFFLAAFYVGERQDYCFGYLGKRFNFFLKSKEGFHSNIHDALEGFTFFTELNLKMDPFSTSVVPYCAKANPFDPMLVEKKLFFLSMLIISTRYSGPACQI